MGFEVFRQFLIIAIYETRCPPEPNPRMKYPPGRPISAVKSFNAAYPDRQALVRQMAAISREHLGASGGKYQVLWLNNYKKLNNY